MQCYNDLEDYLQINRELRDNIEASESEKIAIQICERLPKNDIEIQELLEKGYELAKQMSWDIVVKHYLLPGLQNMIAKQCAA